MNCEIITIGDELLIGQVIDTNSAWMATRLNESGLRVKQITSVSDDKKHIIEALDQAKTRADIILITGGLGPTKDDLTKDTLCEYFNSGLEVNQQVLEHLRAYFTSRGRELTETNRKQAEVPQKCTTIFNNHGTAPGMLFVESGKVYVSMPGVPYEMKAMMDDFVLPYLSDKFKLPEVFHYTMNTIGVGESFLADLLSEWESALPPHIKLAYLPSIGTVKLRLSCYASDSNIQKEVMSLAEKAKSIISKYIFGFGSDTTESVLGALLRERKQTLAIAESCTGGYLSHLVTSVPGSSDYYVGSTISYANDVKSRFLDVDPKVIDSKGAVSEEVAMAMALGVRNKLGTTWSLSTTGVAGPGGGSEEKPVGTVWIGIAGPDRVFAKKFLFGNNRFRNIQMSSLYAFNLLRKELLNLPE
jgi:nicotinamide-nucleotide amidase